MKYLFLLILILCLSVSSVLANGILYKKVFAEHGYIYFSPDGKEKILLTNGGKDRAPVLSPDGKKVAFIRKSDNQADLAVAMESLDCSPEDFLADQIWVVNVDAKNEKILVRDRKSNSQKWDDRTVIGLIDDRSIQFSPDSKKVYFISSAWVTSGAVHCVNIDGSEEHFITPGNSLKVIDNGRYKGHLIIEQHRYFLVGGSYDWLWLYGPDGKEIDPIGPDLNQFEEEYLYSD